MHNTLQNLPTQSFFKFFVKVVEDFGHYILGWKILYIPNHPWLKWIIFDFLKLYIVQLLRHGKFHTFQNYSCFNLRGKEKF